MLEKDINYLVFKVNSLQSTMIYVVVKIKYSVMYWVLRHVRNSL